MRTFRDTSQPDSDPSRRVRSSAPMPGPVRAVASEHPAQCRCGSSRIVTASSVLESVRAKKTNRALDGELARVVHRTVVRRCRDCGHILEAAGSTHKLVGLVGAGEGY